MGAYMDAYLEAKWQQANDSRDLLVSAPKARFLDAAPRDTKHAYYLSKGCQLRKALAQSLALMSSRSSEIGSGMDPLHKQLSVTGSEFSSDSTEADRPVKRTSLLAQGAKSRRCRKHRPRGWKRDRQMRVKILKAEAARPMFSSDVDAPQRCPRSNVTRDLNELLDSFQ